MAIPAEVGETRQSLEHALSAYARALQTCDASQRHAVQVELRLIQGKLATLNPQHVGEWQDRD